MSGEGLKKYRIKDKSGNTKDVTYDPSCGLNPQEFLTVEIARFNAEKTAKKEDVKPIEQSPQPVSAYNNSAEIPAPSSFYGEPVKSEENVSINEENLHDFSFMADTDIDAELQKQSPAGISDLNSEDEKDVSVQTGEKAPVKNRTAGKSLASIMAGKSGIKLSNIAARRAQAGTSSGKRPKGISLDKHVPGDRLITTGVKK
ncbi:MAG: hypothetical protein LBR70_05765 [Lactobacillaceae bacterium]|nr:hypothetical protein [Lactobacillaceae bacterium]